MAEEDANIAASKGILVTTVSFLINSSRSELENLLKNNEYVDDYEIEDLDDKDIRKDVFVIFKNPIDIRYLSNILQDILNR